MESSLCEKPERHASRRLSDHLTFEGQKQKVHSLVDKVYSRENLKLAWERVRANRGASGSCIASHFAFAYRVAYPVLNQDTDRSPGSRAQRHRHRPRARSRQRAELHISLSAL